MIVPGPRACACCGSHRLAKLGEDVTERLEVVPRQWKVVQIVREKFTCRNCEKISQAPAPFHVIARGLVGPSLLALILFEKFGNISRSIAKPNAMPGKVCRSACRPWPIMSEPAAPCSSPAAAHGSPCLRGRTIAHR